MMYYVNNDNDDDDDGDDEDDDVDEEQGCLKLGEAALAFAREASPSSPSINLPPWLECAWTFFERHKYIVQRLWNKHHSRISNLSYAPLVPLNNRLHDPINHRFILSTLLKGT